ncbi:hypothetical protein ACFSYD_07310 [Paracoccus aerius]
MVLVHQEILLAPDLTVAENLFLGRELTRGPMVDDRAMNRRTAEVLASIGAHCHPRDRVGSCPWPSDSWCRSRGRCWSLAPS